MKKPIIFMATIAVLVTTALFIHDYLYDEPTVPYTMTQQITEIFTVGPFFSAIIFGLLYLPYSIGRSLVRKNKG